MQLGLSKIVNTHKSLTYSHVSHINIVIWPEYLNGDDYLILDIKKDVDETTKGNVETIRKMLDLRQTQNSYRSNKKYKNIYDLEKRTGKL